MVITLDANRERVIADRAELALIEAQTLTERAAARETEFASADGDGDFTRIQVAEGRFIDLAIHKDTFLDDAALRTDLDVEVIPVWKSRYEPMVGITTGSVYGGGMATIYATQDNFAQLTPFVVDVEEAKIPKMALTQDPDRLGQREAGKRRQAEALRLAMEIYLVNFMTNAPLGQSIASSIVNYVSTGNPYAGKTVYVADPGVQAGTYETSNIINISTEQGLTPRVAEEIINQMMLTKRSPRTINIPVAGLPWRKLMRYATVVANNLTGAAGTGSNPGLQAIPAAQWEDLWGTNFANGIVLNWFGHTLKFKTNNALPQGYGLITTDQPAAEVFNIMSKSVSMEYSADPRDTYFVSAYEKREIAICVPDPWVRNYAVLVFGNTGGL